MIIEWNHDPAFAPDQATQALMQAAADKCLAAEGVDAPCLITVRYCGDEEIREINRTCRGIDHATDVLSFPAIGYPHGATLGTCGRLLRQEYDDEKKAFFIGDIIISLPHMKAQAEEYGHSEYREAVYLLVHGVCHLMGYDHMQEEERAVMRKMEEKVTGAMGIERNAGLAVSDETLLSLAREAQKKSYSPYSRFSVGAALLTKSGRIFLGCNIENASFGLTNCAERTAMFKAVSEGELEFETIAISAREKAWPCGACRQVMSEFAPDLRVLITWGDGEVEESRLSVLLPGQFSLDREPSEGRE